MDARAQSLLFGARREGEMSRNDLGESGARNGVLTLDQCVGVASKYSFRLSVAGLS